MIFVTHVQSFGPYLKVCGQISDQVLSVENALQQLNATALTQPELHEIVPKEIYLVHSGSQNDFLRRCEVVSANRSGIAKIMLIDYGNEYEVPITQVNVFFFSFCGCFVNAVARALNASVMSDCVKKYECKHYADIQQTRYNRKREETATRNACILFT